MRKLVIGCIGWAGCADELATDVGRADAEWRAVPPPTLTVGEVVPGELAHVTVDGAAPGETVVVVTSRDGLGAGPCPPKLGGACFDIGPAVVRSGKVAADAAGRAELDVPVAVGLPVGSVLAFQAAIPRGLGGVDSVLSAPVVADVVENLIVDAAVVRIAPGTYTYSRIEVVNGGTLEIEGLVELHAALFSVDATSRVDGIGLGDLGGAVGLPGDGIGGGGAAIVGGGGGGGGYGGEGGLGGFDVAFTDAGTRGLVYGTSSGDDVSVGSGGGASLDHPGGAGGAALVVVAPVIDVDGDIECKGADGEDSAGADSSGGGSGGAIVLRGDDVAVAGDLRVQGGRGGGTSFSHGVAGGGGGGGRIKLFHDTAFTLTGTTNTSGGAGGIGAGAIDGDAGDSGTNFSGQVPFVP